MNSETLEHPNSLDGELLPLHRWQLKGRDRIVAEALHLTWPTWNSRLWMSGFKRRRLRRKTLSNITRMKSCPKVRFRIARHFTDSEFPKKLDTLFGCKELTVVEYRDFYKEVLEEKERLLKRLLAVTCGRIKGIIFPHRNGQRI